MYQLRQRQCEPARMDGGCDSAGILACHVAKRRRTIRSSGAQVHLHSAVRDPGGLTSLRDVAGKDACAPVASAAGCSSTIATTVSVGHRYAYPLHTFSIG
jgi:hypothetical protein